MRSGSVDERVAERGRRPLEVAVQAERSRPSAATASLMARTASPSAAPGARLKESVTAGNCPSCAIEIAAWVRSKCAKR